METYFIGTLIVPLLIMSMRPVKREGWNHMKLSEVRFPKAKNFTQVLGLKPKLISKLLRLIL